MSDEHTIEDRNSSKSQRKKDRNELRALANRLTELNQEQIKKIPDSSIKDSVEATQKINKGSARKRQIQYTAKLLSKIDTTQIRKLVDTIDASTLIYVQKFHTLEKWRERLVSGDEKAFSEVLLKHPNCDRQILRQLVRNAIKERASNKQGLHFRKLFQFLKRLT